MNTYKIVVNPKSRHGFNLIVEQEDGSVRVIELTSKTTDNYFKLDSYLPSEYNIRYLSIKQITEGLVDGEYIIQPRTQRVRTNTQSTVTTKNWIDYLPGEDKLIILNLKEKAENIMKVEKIKAQIEEYQKLLSQLTKVQE